jgi:hypothetical protein
MAPGGLTEKWSEPGFDFFISYAHRDSYEYVYDLAEELRSCGFTSFLDGWCLDPTLQGDDFRREASRVLRQVNSFILVSSQGALQSEWIRWEIEQFCYSSPIKRQLFIILFERDTFDGSPYADVTIIREPHELRS